MLPKSNIGLMVTALVIFFSREAMNPLYKVISLFLYRGYYFKHIKTLQGRETCRQVAFALQEACF